jgi:WD40 repeat protein
MTRPILCRGLVLSISLTACILSGCNGSSTDEGSPTDLTENVVEPASLPSEAGSPTGSDVTTGAPDPLPPEEGKPVIKVAHEATSLQIGPGHFNGKREAVVYSSPGVRSLLVSPGGQFAAVGRPISEEGFLLQVWDIPAGKLLNEYHEPLGVTSVAFAPDSRILAYGAGDHSVVLHALPEGQTVRWKRHNLSIGALAFSPDGRQLASLGHDNQLIIWDVGHGTVIAQTTSGDARFVSQVRFVAPDRLWTRDGDGMLRWYNFTGNSLAVSQELKLPEKTGIFASNDEKLYGRNLDRGLCIVDASTGKELPAPELPTPPADEQAQPSHQFAAGAVASNLHILAVATRDGTLRLWAEDSPEPEQTLKLEDMVSALATDSAGRYWIAATPRGLMVIDREAPDTPRWLEQRQFIGHIVPTRFSPDGDAVAFLQSDSVVCADTASGLVRERFAVSESAETIDGSGTVDGTTTTLLPGPHDDVFRGTSTGTVEFLKDDSESEPFHVNVSESAITAMAVTADGQRLLAGDSGGNTVWLNSRQEITPVSQKEHSGTVRTAVFSADGQLAATAGDDHSVVVWDATRQTRRAVLNRHQTPVHALSFSTDGRWLISGDLSGKCILWDVPFSNQAWEVTLPDALLQAQTTEFMLQHADTMAAGMAVGGIISAEFSPDQRVLAVGTASGYLQTFDLVDFRELSPVFVGGPVTDLRFAQDGSSLLAATMWGDVVRYWRAPEPPQMLSKHEGRVWFAALDATGRRAVTGGIDKQLCVWDVDAGKLIQSLENGGEAVTGGALSPDGRRAATAGYGSGVVFWDLDQMQRLDKRYGHQARVWALAFSPDGNMVASGCEDQTVRIWDFATRQTKTKLTLGASVRFVRFSPDGRSLLTSTSSERGWKVPSHFQLWDTASGQVRVEFKGHSSTVASAVFSDDGSEITSLGTDGRICRWKTETGERISDLSRFHGLAHASLMHQGQLLVMLRYSNGVFIDQGKSLTRLSEFNVPTRSIADLNVAARSNRIIAGTSEGPVFVWSIADE